MSSQIILLIKREILVSEENDSSLCGFCQSRSSHSGGKRSTHLSDQKSQFILLLVREFTQLDTDELRADIRR
jgi:hypothetical protein